jgi:hypothetical protein
MLLALTKKRRKKKKCVRGTVGGKETHRRMTISPMMHQPAYQMKAPCTIPIPDGKLAV